MTQVFVVLVLRISSANQLPCVLVKQYGTGGWGEITFSGGEGPRRSCGQRVEALQARGRAGQRGKPNPWCR